MKRITLLQSILVMLVSFPLVSVAADRVGDFSLLDQAGYYHSMSWYDDHESIAFLVQANDSEELESVLPEFMTLKAKYDSLGVQFMMINPQGKHNRQAVSERVAEYGVEVPVLMDDARVISEALGVAKIGDVLLYNPKTFMVDYRGHISGARVALDEILAGESVSSPAVAGTGEAVIFLSLIHI